MTIKPRMIKQTNIRNKDKHIENTQFPDDKKYLQIAKH